MKALPLITALLTAAALGGEMPKGYSLLKETVSPDGSLAVLEPTDEKAAHNQLVEVKTGRVIREIEGLPGYQKMGHGGINSKWSKDSHQLLWVVDGKWGPHAMSFLEVNEKGEATQINVLKAAHSEILARSRKAFPKVYAAAVKQNKGNGEAYPDGFTVSSIDPANAAPPIKFTFALTSNPKAIEGFPERARLDAYMEGALTAERKLEWKTFRAWDAAAGEREEAEGEGEGEGLSSLEDEIGSKLTGAAKKKFDADRQAWDLKQKKEFSDDSKLASLSGLELARRSRLATKARIAELQKRYPDKK